MIIPFPFHPLPIILTYLSLTPQTLSIAIPQSPSNINTNTNSHPNLGSWHALPPIPISPRKEHATVYLDPYIYILGGVIPTNDPTNPFEPTTLTQRYSLLTNTWSTVAPLPLPLTHPNAAVLNGAIYLLGGLTPSSPQAPTLLTTTPNSYIYHPTTNIWSPLPLEFPPTLQVAAAAIATRGNTIYLAGGLTHLNLSISSSSSPSISEQPKITNNFTAYTSGRELLTSLPPLPQPRYHTANGFIGSNGPFLVIGGRGEDSKGEYSEGEVTTYVTDTNFVYDFRVNKWAEGKRMSRAREGMASAVVGGSVFVIGGLGGVGGGDEDGGEYKGEEVLMLNEAYDVLADEWREYAPMDVPRHSTSAIAINQRIYVPGGGISGGGRSTDYFSYFEVP